MKSISIGKQNFLSIREHDNFYVDKTGFIKEWWENEDVVTLITRPRRFGKTLNMNMLECFFSCQYEGQGELFEGLEIWNEEKYQKIQGSYPVIFLSFADIKGTTFQASREGILSVIIELYKTYYFLLNSDKFTEEEKKYIRSFDMDMNQHIEISDTTIARSIKNLSMFLERYYGKKTIILLDEYDTPLQEAYINGYWRELVDFIRGLFNSTFKTNPYLERAVMTGITRVSKESVFSDLNNPEVVTTTSNKYATAFGFTEEEVFWALEEAGMAKEREQVKEWYNGFTFGTHTDIYNPWSITKFLDSGKYELHWADTSSNGLINKLIQKSSADIKMDMEELLKGNTIRVKLDEQIVFEQLEKKKNAIWSLLLASGYLKVKYARTGKSDGISFYDLALTNYEVQLMFDDMIQDWFETQDVSCNDFIKALLKGDLKAMNHYMNKVALATFSFFDSGNTPSKQTEPERFYHGFVLGLMVEQRKDYHVVSNRESGFGRYDVIMEPIGVKRDSLPAIVMEFKVQDTQEEKKLEDTVKSAHEQIEELCYDEELLKRGIKKEQIRHYGFAFQGKRVLIG